MTDLRKIAEFVNYTRDRSKTDLSNKIIEMLTVLLNAVVEERAMVALLLCSKPGPHHKCNHHDQALNELNLKGVGPIRK